MESFVTQLLAQRAETCGVEVTAMRDKATKRLLYIEAGNDFVTLLLSFLVLPVASFLTRLAEENAVPASFCSIAGILKSARVSDQARFSREDFRKPELSSAPKAVGKQAWLFEVAAKIDGVRDSETLSRTTTWSLRRWLAKHRRGGAVVTCRACQSSEETLHHAVEILDRAPRLPVTFVPAGHSHHPFFVTDNLEIWPATRNNFLAILSKLNVRT